MSSSYHSFEEEAKTLVFELAIPGFQADYKSSSLINAPATGPDQ